MNGTNLHQYFYQDIGEILSHMNNSKCIFFIYCLLIVIFLSFNSIYTLDKSDGLSNPIEISRSTSLSGVLNIEEIAGTRIIGSFLQPPGGFLGTHAEIVGSLSGYDLKLLAYDPDPPKTITIPPKRYYTIEGNGARLPSLIQIDEKTPFSWYYWQEKSIPTYAYGDIDGNGYRDEIYVWEGYPELSDPDRPGILQINFKSKDKTMTCNYIGTNGLDFLGDCLVVTDINDDGKHDIVIGAPGADGFNNNRIGCGEIHIILGKDNRSFPANGYIDEVSDFVIEGNNIKGSGYNDYPGDKIGRSFVIGDIDNDGNKDIAISNHLGWKFDDYGKMQKNVGWVSIYNLTTLMKSKHQHSVLSHPSDWMTVYSNDEGDSLGWILKIKDLDFDGCDDLLITAPHADGIGNLQPRCGEVFIIYGNGLRVADLSISGSSVLGKKVFCNSGTSFWNISIVNTNQKNDIDLVDIKLHQDEYFINMSINENYVTQQNIGKNDLQIISFKYNKDGNYHFYCVELYFNMTIPFNGITSVDITVIDNEGIRTTDFFPNHIKVCKDVKLIGNPIIFSNNKPIEETGGFSSPGSSIEIYGIDVAFQESNSMLIDPGTILLSLSTEKATRSTYLNGINPFFSIVSRDINNENLKITLKIENNSVGQFSPNFGDPLHVTIPIDQDAPNKPTLIQSDVNQLDTDNEKKFNIQYEVENEIGKEGDNGESGIKYYSILVDDIYQSPLMAKGGLYSTCFIDDSFTLEGYKYIEQNFDIDWGKWGPEPNFIPPNGYSVRWHGWTKFPKTGLINLTLDGEGMIKINFGYVTILNWSNLKFNPTIRNIPVTKEEYIPIEIYFKNIGDDSKIEINIEDTKGNWRILGNGDIYYPSSFFNHTYSLIDSINISISGIDWTLKESKSVFNNHTMDLSSPYFILPKRSIWHKTNIVKINVTIVDKKINPDINSSIDINKIKYRIWSEQEKFPSEWKKENLKIEDVSNDISSIMDVQLKLKLDDYWKGMIQFNVSDFNGNEKISNYVPIKIDLKPPEIDSISPIPISTVDEGPLLIEFEVSDHKGSGIKPESFEYRIKYDEFEWGPWEKLDLGYRNEKIIGSKSLNVSQSILKVQGRCADNVGWISNSEIVRINVVPITPNHPPIPVISLPINNSHYSNNSIIKLDATGTFDDGLGMYEKVDITWISNISGILSKKGVDSVLLPPGYHEITLYVDDGDIGHNISLTVKIYINGSNNENENGDDDEIINHSEQTNIWLIFLSIPILIIITVPFLIIYNIIKKR